MKLKDLFESVAGNDDIDVRHHRRAGSVYKKKMAPFVREVNNQLQKLGFGDLDDYEDFLMSGINYNSPEYAERLDSLRSLMPLLNNAAQVYNKLYHKFGDVLHWVPDADFDMQVGTMFDIWKTLKGKH